MMKLYQTLVFTLLLTILIGCGGTATKKGSPADSGLKHVELQLNWFPEAEHGGFYAALVHGYFQEEGLDVTIRPGGPNVPVILEVADGRTQFAVCNADQILQARAQDADVVAVLAAMQDSPRCILVHKETGITQFDQLKDLKLAIGSGRAFAEYLKKKVPLENVQLVPYGGSLAPFLADKRFAQQGYIFSEPFVAEQQGAEVNCLMLSDLGFNNYASLLFTNGKLIKDDPELIAKMVRATRRGWQKYLEDPEETNRRIHEENPEMGLDILAYGAKELRPLCLPAGMSSPDDFGGMSLKRWQTLADQMIEAGVLEPERVKPAEAFTDQFLSPRE